MKVTYDPQVDVLKLVFSDAQVAESDEQKPSVILDFDEAGHVVAIEILDASKRVDNPRGMDYQVTQHVA